MATDSELAPFDLTVGGVHVTKDGPTGEDDTTLRNDDQHRAYAQWVSIEVVNYGPLPIQVKGVYTLWGKLYINGQPERHSPSVLRVLTYLAYSTGDKDAEVRPSHFENRIINPNGSLTIAACGRAHSPSGTEGGFNLVNPNGNDAIIRSIYWDCPWGSKTNTWRVTGSLSGWEVFDRGANLNSGALGNITVETVFRG